MKVSEEDAGGGVRFSRAYEVKGGGGYAIISLFTTLAALVLAVMLLLRIPCMVPFALLFAGLSVFTILISWACVAGAFTIKMCGDRWSNFAMKYGPGFGLMVTAWCLQIANVVVLSIISFG